jgi:4-hydroxy-3-polyprenylbenzoate decarboxylase
MSHETLTRFLSALEDRGEVVRIGVEVDANLEIAEITRRVRHERDGGPALVFDNVRGRTIPVVTNLLATESRVQRLLETDDFDALAERVFGLVTPDVPESWLEALKLVPRVSQLTNVPPRLVKSGDVQQVVKLGRDVNLAELPIPRAWPSDAAPAITAGHVFTRHPETGTRNVDRFPLSVRDRSSLFVHWDVHRTAHRAYEWHRERHERMPIAVVLGGDPLLGLVARAPLPPETDGLLLAGLLRRSPVDLVKGRSIELAVPAKAEIVLEGFVDTTEKPEPAGPIASDTGFEGLPERLPVLHVTAITHRANPVFPAMIATPPPTADRWVEQAIERLLVPFVRLFVPELVDLHFPPAGVFRNLLFVSIDKRFPGQARKVMNAVWALSPLVHAKLVVVVDREVDVHDTNAVWYHAGANVHPGRDVAFWDGPTAMDDHAAAVRGMGRRMGVDGTAKLPGEGHDRPWPFTVEPDDDTDRLVTGRWAEYGL